MYLVYKCLHILTFTVKIVNQETGLIIFNLVANYCCKLSVRMLITVKTICYNSNFCIYKYDVE